MWLWKTQEDLITKMFAINSHTLRLMMVNWQDDPIVLFSVIGKQTVVASGVIERIEESGGEEVFKHLVLFKNLKYFDPPFKMKDIQESKEDYSSQRFRNPHRIHPTEDAKIRRLYPQNFEGIEIKNKKSDDITTTTTTTSMSNNTKRGKNKRSRSNLIDVTVTNELSTTNTMHLIRGTISTTGTSSNNNSNDVIVSSQSVGLTYDLFSSPSSSPSSSLSSLCDNDGIINIHFFGRVDRHAKCFSVDLNTLSTIAELEEKILAKCARFDRDLKRIYDQHRLKYCHHHDNSADTPIHNLVVLEYHDKTTNALCRVDYDRTTISDLRRCTDKIDVYVSVDVQMQQYGIVGNNEQTIPTTNNNPTTPTTTTTIIDDHDTAFDDGINDDTTALLEAFASDILATAAALSSSTSTTTTTTTVATKRMRVQ